MKFSALALAALSVSGTYAAAAGPRVTPAPAKRQDVVPTDPAGLKAYTESVYSSYAAVIAAHPEAKSNILSASSIFQNQIDQINSMNGVVEGNPGDVVTVATIGMNTGVPQKTVVTENGMTYTPYIADAPGDVTYSYQLSTISGSKAPQSTPSAAGGNVGGGAATIKPAFAAVLAVVAGAFML